MICGCSWSVLRGNSLPGDIPQLPLRLRSRTGLDYVTRPDCNWDSQACARRDCDSCLVWERVRKRLLPYQAGVDREKKYSLQQYLPKTPCLTSRVIALAWLSCRSMEGRVQDQPIALSWPLSLPSLTLQVPYPLVHRYHQHQPFLTSSWLTFVPSGSSTSASVRPYLSLPWVWSVPPLPNTKADAACLALCP